ncbi:hypothetical protein NKR23_g11614 [Pleurostoma richardsiae]|uniref:Protein FAF1 n=1 Tax=Pleurostoma richardsiae TaxID=41990 RepID=A0AA38RA73_9PEZI|nr:hypothetical protein NKR23_g11614 [Pleurostoma richardsiae]
MGSLLGKRKARVAEEEDNPTAAIEDAQAIFRAHFEARFKPLPAAAAAATDEDDEDEESPSEDASISEPEDASGSEWGGIDDDDDDDSPAVEVIDHTTPTASAALATTAMSKSELRAYLSSRPPSTLSPASASLPSTGRASSSTKTVDPEDAPSLLANDLALQRLLSESHLLASLSPSASTATASSSSSSGGGGAGASGLPSFAAGRARAKATDMRLRALGSRESIFAQKKMPMAMRRGMAAAAAGREKKRRREAREGGVVLEREQNSSSGGSSGKRRSKGGGGGPRVDMPGVGRMKGAELRLSSRDVRSIEGTRSRGGGKGAGGKKKRR